jgi:chorismate mutase / prephenate dehydratase
MEIEENRRRIDALDKEIIRLINERAECARRIGAAKKQSDRSPYDPVRERQVLEKAAGHNAGPLPDRAIEAIYREIMSACLALQRPVTVAFWGPAASNTHVAARRGFGSQAQYVETGSIPETFAQVARGAADFGVVPVENSTEGVIARTLDEFLDCDLEICSEIYVPIQHNLLSRAATVAELKRVYTMFQATGQCREWMGKHLGHVELLDTTTTARGAALAAGDPEAGAIANTAAAEEYGLSVLAEHIEDNPRNWTRFWVIGRLSPTPSGADKTSLLFAVPHRPGALVRALEVFSRNGVSMTFIESRPTKQTPWEYLFFIDITGHRGEPDSPTARALAELEEHCLFTRVLGSYPESE